LHGQVFVGVPVQIINEKKVLLPARLAFDKALKKVHSATIFAFVSPLFFLTWTQRG
jgi:hypothetical protein